MTTSIRVFVDSSAMMSLLDPRQEMHGQARAAWVSLLHDEFELITSNYVVVETCSLIQRRSGVAAVLTFTTELLPALRVVWVDPETHTTGLVSLLAAAQRDLALVDCTSFEVMRREGVRHAFAFDRHFQDRGMVLPPLPLP